MRMLTALVLAVVLESTGAAALGAPGNAADANGAPEAKPASEGGKHASTADESAPEPSGYWTGPVNSPVPATLTGGTVISSAHRLRELLDQKDSVLVDVSNAPTRPDNMAPGAPWLPVPHRAIPGSVWIPGVGAGEIPAALDDFFRQKLATLTDNSPFRRVILYCHKTCWLSWNAAKRAISYGYQHVYWYRDGVEGWKAAGLPTAVIEPQATPGD